MNFKDMAQSGEFQFTVPEFDHGVERKNKSRMAGEYMEKFYKPTEYTPQAGANFEANATTFGVRNPFSDAVADEQYKQGLDDDERRKNWKHNNT